MSFTRSSHGQSIYPVNGPGDFRDITYALINGQIISSWDSEPIKGTLIFKMGKIVAIGENIDIPKDAVVIDLSGKYLYPAFIDPYTSYGLPQVSKETPPSNKPQYERRGEKYSYWNEAIKPGYQSVSNFSVSEKEASELRKLGFGAALSINKDGICRGTAPLVLLSNLHEVQNIILPSAVTTYSFNKGSSQQAYPGSLIGAIALIRQFLYDADWYQKGGSTEYYEALESFSKTNHLPKFFEADNWQNALRVNSIAGEFNLNFVVKGGGNEYQRITEIKKTGFSFILPLNFPVAYDVNDIYESDLIPFSSLKHWELAPGNPAAFANSNIPFAFTLDGLTDKKDFRKNIIKAISYGLPKNEALKALTATPAEMINAGNLLGKLAQGYFANVVITDGDIFDENSSITETWVNGVRYRSSEIPETDIRGNYTLTIGEENFPLEITGKIDRPQAKIPGTGLTCKITLNSEIVSFSIKTAAGDTSFSLSGTINGNGDITGSGKNTFNLPVTWKAIKTSAFIPVTKNTPITPQLQEVIYPFEAYGRKNVSSKPDRLLITNATIWTNEAEGIIENTDIMLSNGKIEYIGKNLQAPANIRVINAQGKHVTPGIIDEHTHIAITGGVNEGTQSSTAEVRISDAINSEDINIYRQLAGGVTTVQQLHGSANQIGGQSSLIKLRWGKTPEEMKFENAPGFIKFALGENVKQSNWGDNVNERYPQTRMGVEQYYYDIFTRAIEYGILKSKGGKNFRIDLDLEIILEILNGKRDITCHSYVQSEINMLMNVADSMGFKVNTFTHILEGYKVADKMKKHGANASAFSDWWGFKFEVYEAIPYNGAIMNKVGLNVAFNSDDAELARRLNLEAAKAVKYGGVSQEEALKFVTLNPAKMLKIDDRVGSLKPGKDADLVIWSDNPLSVSAKVETTIIDGIIYFDRISNNSMSTWIKEERERIFKKMTDSKNSGEPSVKHERKKEIHYHCDTILENYIEEIE